MRGARVAFNRGDFCNFGVKPNKMQRRKNMNLSIFCVAALGGFTEELQQGGPAVGGLVFDHHRAQLGERVLHRVPATHHRL